MHMNSLLDGARASCLGTGYLGTFQEIIESTRGLPGQKPRPKPQSFIKSIFLREKIGAMALSVRKIKRKRIDEVAKMSHAKIEWLASKWGTSSELCQYKNLAMKTKREVD